MGSCFGFDSSINLWSILVMDELEKILDSIDEGLIEIDSINLTPSILDNDDNYIDAENNGK
jgi:hypothetical protein